MSLLHSEFSRRFDLTIINLTIVRSIRDLERFRVNRLFKLARLVGHELYRLLTRRYDISCYPISVNRNAFLKDAVLLALARSFSVPTVLYAHGNNLPDFYAQCAPWMKRVIDTTIRNAAAGIVQGECLRFNFKPWLSPEKIFVVPAGFEPFPVPPRARCRDGRFRVLYLGAMVREKGVFVLLEAAAKIVRTRDDIDFHFVGAWYDQQEHQTAIEYVRLNGLERFVRFTGQLSNEAKWQAVVDADLLALPTFYYYETMGGVLLEAMEAGLPVVATRRAAIPEIVHDGVNGLLVEEQNADDLKDKILKLAADAALREQMGRANRKRFAEYYTHEQYGQRMIAVFEQLTSRASR